MFAYIRLLPWVKRYCCLPPRVTHNLLFALGIAECFLLPLHCFINARSELWGLGGRFCLWRHGKPDPNCSTRHWNSALFSSGPRVNFCTGLWQKIFPRFWPLDLKSPLPPYYDILQVLDGTKCLTLHLEQLGSSVKYTAFFTVT